MIIPGLFSFVNVFEPKADLSGRMKYSLQLLIPKSNEAVLNTVRAEIAKVIAAGVAKGKYTIEQTRSAKFKNPLRDGDEYYDDQPGAARLSCREHFFINAANTDQPDIVDRFGNPIMDPGQVYSGCEGLADIEFFPFSNKGNTGIGASLQNVMKKKDGARLDGRQKADQAFSQYVDNPSDEEADAATFD